MEKSITVADGTTQKPKKDRKARLKYSAFLVTINPNKPGTDLKKELNDIANHCFNEHLEDFLNIGSMETGKKPYAECEKAVQDLVESSDVDAVVERGPKNKSDHLHALIKLKHRTILQLNITAIISYVKNTLDLPHSPHVNVKLIPMKSSLENYLHKYSTA